MFGALLAPTLTGMTLVLMIGEAVTVPLVAAVFTVLPALIAAVLAIKYLLSIAKDEPTRTTADIGRRV